jgi:hypothetical protein
MQTGSIESLRKLKCGRMRPGWSALHNNLQTWDGGTGAAPEDTGAGLAARMEPRPCDQS